MKKRGVIGMILGILIVRIIFGVIAYNIEESNKQSSNPLNANDVKLSKTFKVDEYNMTVMTPSGWKKLDDNDNADLYLQDKDGRIFMLLYAYTADEIGTDITDEELFYIQCEDALAMRENVKEYDPVKIRDYSDRNIYTSYYSYEVDGTKVYQRMSLIYYKDTGNAAWVTFVSPTKNEAMFSKMVLNIKEK